MRALVAIAILAFLAAGVSSAGAADRIGGSRRSDYTSYAPVGYPAPPLVIYDYDPGVVVRAYWLPPWRDHHYFPFGRDRWDIRRVKAPAGRPRPAETFRRYWSNSGAFVNDLPPAVLQSFDTAPAPRTQNRSKLVKPDENNNE
jgi:hypothetical protein